MNTIIALVQDERFRRPIQQIANEREWQIIWQLDPQGVVTTIAELRPLLILIDLRSKTHDWLNIARALKTNPATRRLALIGFAAFLDQAIRQKAASVFLDEIVEVYDNPRGEILSELPLLINAHARRLDSHHQRLLSYPCDHPMPDLVRHGLETFNQGEYYEAHEILEAAWMAESGLVRDVYRGILQIGVAYYQIQRKNYWGAIKMFLRAIQWLEPLPDVCHGINIQQCRQDALIARQHLEALGPDRIAEFDMTLLKPIVYKDTQRG